MPDQPFFIDGVSSFPKGTNSGVDPFLLDRDTLSFCINGTVRGSFVTHRPAYWLRPLDFGGDALMQSRFEQGLWQGACYFNSEYGEQGLVCSIGGRIFFIVILANTFTVRDVTLPADPNSDSNPISWLWQSERWVIIQNGLQLPLFFDGQTMRRSFGPAQPLGQVAVGQDFAAPAIGSSINITLNAPYTGPVNQSILIDSAFYMVTSATGGGYRVKLRSINVPNTIGYAGANGVDVQMVPNTFIGLTSSPVFWSGFATGVTLQFPPPISATPGTVSVGDIGAQTFSSHDADSVNNAGGTVHLTRPFGGPALTFQSNSAVYQGYYSPVALAGRTTETAFSGPGVGSDLTLHFTTPYLGALGELVTINGMDIYEIIESDITIPPSATITVQNINDVAGTLHGPASANLGFLTTIPEMQIGRMGAYGLGRNWYSLPDGRSYRATDIVGGSSGSPSVNNRDSVLRETENTYLTSGDFIIPGNIGNIRSMTFTATLDTSLGQGPLQVGTPYIIFSCNAPIDRATWQALENPIQTQSLIGQGTQGQNNTVLANSDTLFRSLIGLGSLILARREFATWGNTPISREVQRIINQDDTTLLFYGSAINFGNRLLETSKPTQGAQGVYHPGVIALNFEPISSLAGKAPSVYDGLWIGVNALQWVQGQFNSLERGFAFTYNRNTAKIELYELLMDQQSRVDNNGSDVRIKWQFETACLFKDLKGKGLFDSVLLQDGEFYIADVFGTVDFSVYYRPQFSKCWILWHEGQICATNTGVNVQPQNRVAIGLGKPSTKDCDPANNRPYAAAESHQFKFVFTGSCKFYGALFKASLFPERAFTKVQCDSICIGNSTENCEPCKTVQCVIESDYGTYLLEDILPPPEPAVIFNQPVYFVHECPEGETLIFTGTLPSWITLDSGNSRLVGAAGTYQAATLAEANALAQNALNEFGNAAVAAANLDCEGGTDICADGLGDLVDNIYGITGYVDGLIENPDTNPTGNPLWDGTFSFFVDNGIEYGWTSGEPDTQTMEGDNGFCIHYLFFTCAGDVPTWTAAFGDTSGTFWRGEKVGGQTPEGTYTRISGTDPGPASIEIELAAGTTTQTVNEIICGS